MPDLSFEEEIWAEGRILCGVDEVGRGCLAGPVVAAAVVMPKGHKPIDGICDSKKLTRKKREELFDIILDNVADFGVGLVPAIEIDNVGIASATKRAMAEAVKLLTIQPDTLLVDAYEIDEMVIDQKPIAKGDEVCYSIACASIVAKVFRDSVVAGLHHDFPKYGFPNHKGYGTKKHREAIKKHGTTREHRRTFKLKDSNSKIKSQKSK